MSNSMRFRLARMVPCNAYGKGGYVVNTYHARLESAKASAMTRNDQCVVYRGFSTVVVWRK
jgi:hypothetical protein